MSKRKGNPDWGKIEQDASLKRTGRTEVRAKTTNCEDNTYHPT